MVKSEIATQCAMADVTSAVDVSDCIEFLIIGDAPATIKECDTSSGTFTDVAATDLVEGGDGVIAYTGYKQFIKCTFASGKSAVGLKVHVRHCPAEPSN